MNPGNPFYATTKDLKRYSTLITRILASPCIPLIGKIEEDPHPPVPHGEDCLAYWDKFNIDICYGRFLLCKKVIKFWFGLSSKPEQANLIIWFKKSDINAVNKDYINNLRTFEPKNRYHEPPNSDEVWITMEDKDFEKFCNNSSARKNIIIEKFCKNSSYNTRKDIIIKFWQSVLGELN